MAFLAPAAAATTAGTIAGSTALGLPGVVGAVAPGAFGAGVTGAGLGGLGAALGTGLAAGAGTAGTIFGASSLGLPGLISGVAPGAFGAGVGGAASGLGGVGSALGATGLKTAGTTAALEAAKQTAISTAMQNQAIQNAMMQNVAGGIASPAAQTATKLATTLTPSQQAFLNASTAGPGAPVQMLGPKVNIPADSVGNGWGSYTMDGVNRTNFLANQVPTTPPVTTPTVVPQVAPTAPTSPYDLSLGYKSGIDPRFVGSEGIQPVTSVTPDPTAIMGRGIRPGQNFLQNLANIGSFQDVKDYVSEHPYASAGIGLGAYQLMKPKEVKPPAQSPGMIRPYTFDYNARPEAYGVSPTADSSERLYFNPVFTAQTPYEAPGPEYAAGGGLMGYAVGGPVEQMAAMNSVGMNTGYPMAGINTPVYSNPMMQRPEATNVLAPSADAGVGAYSGEPRFNMGGSTGSGFGTGAAISRGHGMGPALGGRHGGEQSSGYTYTYNPVTQQFTQVNGPTSALAGRSGFGKISTTPSTGAVTGGIASVSKPTTPTQPQSPMAPIDIPAYQTPEQRLGLGGFYDYMNQQLAGYGGYPGYAAGGDVYDLGGYSDGGRLLKGPGNGTSDSIPAIIGKKQPARLADGEFVIPSRIVSELGNGSTESGARQLYAMMDRIQKARRKTVGKGKVAVDAKARNELPA